MATKRPPAAVRREVRQRVGFGCVLCGSPVYDYDHIYGYDKTGDDPDAITLLCRFHHHEKTVGRLPLEFVEEANGDPHNLRHAISSPHPIYFRPPVTLILGNLGLHCAHPRQPYGVSVDRDFLIGAEIRETVELSFHLRDVNNALMLRVKQGEILFANDLWDITFEGNTITVRDALRSVVLEIELSAPNEVLVKRADVWLHHVHFLIGSSAEHGGLEIPANGNSFSNFTIDSGIIAIGEDPTPGGVFLVDGIRGYGAPAIRARSPFRQPEE